MTIVVDDREVIEAVDKVIDLERELLPKMEDLTDKLRSDLQDYPPQPASSSYTRTERLKNSWLKELFVSSDALWGRVESFGVPYGPLVQSHTEQAYMHRGRWQTDQDVADRNEDYALELFDGQVQLILS